MSTFGLGWEGVWWANAVLQNEYASILAKRVNEEKAKKSELRSKWLLHIPRSKEL